MGPAYKNVLYEEKNVVISGFGVLNTVNPSMFNEGDEIEIISGNNKYYAWISSTSGGVIKCILKSGASVPSGTYNIKILYSGLKNNLSTYMAEVQTMVNPRPLIGNPILSHILQATSTEFANIRKTHCDCINQNNSIPYTSNPYITGTKGVWRPIKAYTYLTRRTQTRSNDNTYIRDDGVFDDYKSFYYFGTGGWQKAGQNWTYTSEVTEFNVFGQETENRDPINRYSSASFGYNQSAAISVATNSKYKEQGFDGFEDYGFNPCVDDHFKVSPPFNISNQEAHTGRYSMKVSQNQPVTYTKQIAINCSPTNTCNVSINTTTISSNSYNIVASGGTAPYTVVWSIINGGNNMQFNLTTNGINITLISPTVSVNADIYFTDANGCSKKINFQKP